MSYRWPGKTVPYRANTRETNSTYILEALSSATYVNVIIGQCSCYAIENSEQGTSAVIPHVAAYSSTCLEDRFGDQRDSFIFRKNIP